MAKNIKTQVVVLGAGPAGYSAAFRCADLGLEVTLVEKYSTLGGVCLNVGCIPSKALLHLAKVIKESKEVVHHGITFGEPTIDIDGIRGYKNDVIKKLTDGLGAMSKMRKVNTIQGVGTFKSNTLLEVTQDGETIEIEFEKAIIAAGSSSIKLPFIPHDHPSVWDSTDALELKKVPKKLLIMGGGIIGLEMGTVYKQLGSQVDVVEMLDQIIPVADTDIIKAYVKANKDQFNIMTKTKVTSVEGKGDSVVVNMEASDGSTITDTYDAILVAIGRSANGKKIGLENTDVKVNDYGIIEVDKQMRTSVENIFAIGDIVGQPMLAHKGVHEGHVAAEVIAGMKHFFEPKMIPSIAYTFPEIAWAGLTEKEAKEAGIDYEVSTFPWSASGRAIASGVSENAFTKLIIDKSDDRIIGGAIVGDNAGELLGEIGLAIEMDCDSEDIGLTIHAHPTLHESIGMCAEVYDGTITDIPNKKAKKG